MPSVMRESNEFETMRDPAPPPPHNLRGAQRPSSILHATMFLGHPQWVGSEPVVRVSVDRPAAGPVTRRAC